MTFKQIKYRDAKGSDIQKTIELLQASDLPSSDIDGKTQKIVVAECKEKLVAAGGIEKLGSLALIRSIAVRPEYRNNGIASSIYHLLEKYARDSSVEELYLITESAKAYFQKLGFLEKDRPAVPRPIRQTSQFTRLCPLSATVMFKTLSTK